MIMRFRYICYNISIKCIYLEARSNSPANVIYTFRKYNESRQYVKVPLKKRAQRFRWNNRQAISNNTRDVTQARL